MPRVSARLLIGLLLPVATAFASGIVATPEQLNRQGVALYQQGHPEQAPEPLKQAVQASPYQTTIRHNLIAAYLAAGRTAMEQHRYQQAADLLLEARDYDAEEPQLWLYRAHALVQLRQFDEAEVDLQEARSLIPESEQVPLLKLLGKVYDQTGRGAEAIETWRQALAMAPADQDLKQALARAERAYALERHLDRQVGGQFLLHFDAGENSEIGGEILDTLQDAYAEVGSLFASYPQEQISVLIYTRQDFATVTASPGWAGGVYDGKIRLPLGGLRSLTEPARAVLYHEYTHVVVRQLTNGACPTWLNEGLAEVVAREHFDHPLMALPEAARSGQLLGFDRLSGSLQGLAGNQAQLAYEQSFSFVRFLIDRYGWPTLLDLLQSLGAGQDLEMAIRTAFADAGADLAGLVQQWRDQLAVTGN